MIAFLHLFRNLAAVLTLLSINWKCLLRRNSVLVTALRDGGIHPLVVDYSEYYNYRSIHEKMLESLSINNCTIDGDFRHGVRDHRPADLTVKEVPPHDIVFQKWGPRNEKRKSSRIFAHVSENLCKSQKFKDILKGFYKRAKGCYKVYAEDKKTGMLVKRFNDYGATLHPEHIRCENQVATTVCNAGNTGIQKVPDEYRRLYSFPFVIHAKNVVVGRGGMFSMPCGPFGLFSSCEAVKFGVPAAHNVSFDVDICRQSPRKCPHRRFNRVFVMTQYDDTQIGQFMQEALPKLVYHLKFLQDNPDIMIHYGFTKQPTVPNFVLPHYFFSSFGLLDRLVNGTLYAKEIIMPREGGCQDIGYNAWEVVSMRETFYNMLGIKEDANFKQKVYRQPTVLLLTRSAGAFTQNKADFTVRRWSPAQLEILLPALKAAFPDHVLEIFADTNATLMSCPLCQAEMFSRADVVIGHHGAGLSNAMFMKPGGVIVEVVYNYDSRHMPILGIFPRIADIIGLHHFSYYIGDIKLDVLKFVNETLEFSKKARLWA